MKRTRMEHTEAELKALAQCYVDVVYAYQIKKYGRIRARLYASSIVR